MRKQGLSKTLKSINTVKMQNLSRSTGKWIVTAARQAIPLAQKAVAMSKAHAKPFALHALWYAKRISLTSYITSAVLVLLAGLSTAISLAIFSGKGATEPLTINYREPKRSSILSFSSKDVVFKSGQPVNTTLDLDTGGAVISSAYITVLTDPSLVEINSISGVGLSCSQLTVSTLNKATGELTFACNSVTNSATNQKQSLVNISVTPKAPITGYLTIDPVKTSIKDVNNREVFKPADAFAITIPSGERNAVEQLRVPATALNVALSGCVADASAAIRWIKPVGAKNIEYQWSDKGVPQTPSIPTSSNGSSFPLKDDVVHIATVRAVDSRGLAGPTSVVRVVSCQ